MAEAKVTGPGVAEMQLLAARLKTADLRLRRNLARQLRDAAGPAAEAARQAILTMPVHGDRPRRGVPHPPHQLRREIADTVSVRASAGTGKRITVTITSAGAKMPEGKQELPKHFDSSRGFAHPVYARGARFRLAPSRARKYRRMAEGERPLVKRGNWTWVRQTGRPQWFEQPIAGAYPQFRRAAEQALEDTKRELGG